MDYLKSRDERLAWAIDTIGMLKRPVISNPFHAIMYIIIGQQISTKARLSIWQNMQRTFPKMTPQAVASFPKDELQKIGLTFRKVDYMQDIAQRILNKQFNLRALKDMSDDDVTTELCKLKGIGAWSAEMLLYSMQRSNVLSFGDIAIHRGMRMLYHHKTITKTLFEKYRKRYNPYASVASIYLWAIAGGAIPNLKDYAVKSTTRNKEKNEK